MKPTKARRVFTFFNLLFLTLLMIVCIIPLWHILCISVSENRYAVAGQVGMWPMGFTLEAYSFMAEKSNFVNGLFVSLQRVLLGTSINLLMCILTAYPLSREQHLFRLRTVYVWFFAVTMFFGGGMIPTFLLVQKLGLYDSIWAMIIPGAMQVYNMIIMRTYFQSIPGELMEAARIDGANEWQTLWRIVLPLSKASIATIGLFYAVAHWNSWFNASIYLSTADKAPLQLVLRNMIFNAQTLARTGEAEIIGATTINYAALFISMVPMMVLYPFVQKYFVKGVMVGSVKG